MALKLYRRNRKECEGGYPEDSRSGEFEEGRRGWKKCSPSIATVYGSSTASTATFWGNGVGSASISGEVASASCSQTASGTANVTQTPTASRHNRDAKRAQHHRKANRHGYHQRRRPVHRHILRVLGCLSIQHRKHGGNPDHKRCVPGQNLCSHTKCTGVQLQRDNGQW